MRAIKEARKFIAQRPDHPSAPLLARLVLALETETAFALSDLYRMDYETFELAINILREWRLDRYYAGKGKLFDISLQLLEMGTDASKEQETKPAP